MVRIVLLSICIYFPLLVSGQFKGQIKAADDQAPVPFVNIWIKGEYKGTSANQQGYFSLPVHTGDTLVLSSVGFEKLEFVVGTLVSDTVNLLMKKQAVVLDEVAVMGNRNAKGRRYTIDKIDKWKIRSFIGTGGVPIMYGFVIEQEEVLMAGMGIKSVSFVTKSEKVPSTVLIRLYEKGTDGLPGNSLHTTPILVECKRGKHITTVDVEQMNLSFPSNGLIVAIELLCIEENTIEITVTDARGPGKPEKIKRKHINPYIGTSDSHQQNTLVYSKGDWYLLARENFPPQVGLKSIPFRLELKD
ncbi:carboxypeptidase-like regulatory domain-containing protein [Cytophagales bacterium LB-30]|uniref:Carboxypeptidase-like regulatory domain-containing protein n=1 Tax=Shiella aurantiaca TaxID=3058365 RepID=A0ABT8F407_9BACT|nr:carboxypeptidase-like regulatory domain-containing protein [Shiella aurantiaca]MDN4165125.1 carboxypeptidase-like regulatory domain-containing protein [Shiella aurantiaca]